MLRKLFPKLSLGFIPVIIQSKRINTCVLSVRHKKGGSLMIRLSLMVQNLVNNCNRFTRRWQCNQFCYCIPRLRTNYFFIRSDSSPTSTTFFVLTTGMNPKTSCGVLNPPLRGIVQLTNSAAPIVTPWCPLGYLGYSLSELEFHE